MKAIFWFKTAERLVLQLRYFERPFIDPCFESCWGVNDGITVPHIRSCFPFLGTEMPYAWMVCMSQRTRTRVYDHVRAENDEVLAADIAVGESLCWPLCDPQIIWFHVSRWKLVS